MNERVGHGGHAVSGQKRLTTQRSVGRYARKSPIIKWANVLKESPKKFSEPERSLSQQCQLIHTDTDGLLEHSPSAGSLFYKGPALQKIIPGCCWLLGFFFFGPSS